MSSTGAAAPAVRGDGRPRRRGASGIHIAALLQLHDVDAHVPAFEAAPLRYTRPTVRDVFVARRAIRGHARRRGRRDCRALRRWCEGRGVRVPTRLRDAETAPACAPRRGPWRASGRVASKTAAADSRRVPVALFRKRPDRRRVRDRAPATAAPRGRALRCFPGACGLDRSNHAI